MTEFSDFLKKTRKEKNLSLKEVARRGNLSHSYLSQLENGKRNPKPDILKKLSIGLNVPYMKLMDLAGYGEVTYSHSLIEAFNDTTKDAMQEVKVMMPSFEIERKGDLEATGSISQEESIRRLFDLKDWLDLDMDLYYDRKNLSAEDRERIKSMLKILFEKE